jgi:hypothetical protein
VSDPVINTVPDPSALFLSDPANIPAADASNTAPETSALFVSSPVNIVAADPVNTMPEPTTLLLVAIGGVAALARRRHR